MEEQAQEQAMEEQEQAGQIKYKVLRVNEWQNWPEIYEVYRQRGMPMPDPRFAGIAIAYSGSELYGQMECKGFLVLNVTLHAEPLVAFTPHCIRGLFECLDAHVLDKFGAGVQYFSMVPAGGVEEKIAGFVGMADTNLKTYKKVVLPAGMELDSDRPDHLPQ